MIDISQDLKEIIEKTNSSAVSAFLFLNERKNINEYSELQSVSFGIPTANVQHTK